MCYVPGVCADLSEGGTAGDEPVAGDPSKLLFDAVMEAAGDWNEQIQLRTIELFVEDLHRQGVKLLKDNATVSPLMNEPIVQSAVQEVLSHAVGRDGDDGDAASSLSVSASGATLIPRDFWREVPCGHPPDPIAMFVVVERVDHDSYWVCHCGNALNPMESISDGVEEGAPGPIVTCSDCGCHVALAPEQ